MANLPRLAAAPALRLPRRILKARSLGTAAVASATASLMLAPSGMTARHAAPSSLCLRCETLAMSRPARAGLTFLVEK